MTATKLDACFAEMANDKEYQGDAVALAREFECSDWEAFQLSKGYPISDDARCGLEG